MGAIKVDVAGRIVLPKVVRNRFGWKRGTRLRLDIDEAGIRLTGADKGEASLVEHGGVLYLGGVLTDEVPAVDTVREARTREIAGDLLR